MIYYVFEIMKLTAWLLVVSLAIYKRKEISVNVFWLSVISGFLMAIGSVDDLLNYELVNKSGWWFMGNLFVIINYLVILRRSWNFFGRTKRKLSDFVEQLEKDRKELINNEPTDIF